MENEKFYDVHFLHTLPYLVIMALGCLGIAKSPDFLGFDVAAQGGKTQYIYEEDGRITDIREYEEKLKNSTGVLTEENETKKPEEAKISEQKTKTETNNGLTGGAENKTRVTVNIINKNNPEKTPIVGRNSDAKNTDINTKRIETEKRVINTQRIRNEINITGRTIPLFRSTNTLTDSGNMVAEYGNKFLYGHNTAGVFAGLSGMREGETFTVTRNGKKETFVLAKKELLTKARTADFMVAIVGARFMGQQYDLSLMTCAGEPRPNMDATHRLLIFAKKIA